MGDIPLSPKGMSNGKFVVLAFIGVGVGVIAGALYTRRYEMQRHTFIWGG